MKGADLDLVGRRVRLVRSTDEYTKLSPGELGTVVFGPDALGTLHVKWECGATLGLIPGEDAWEMVD